MQIRKSFHVFVFILKWYAENFAFRILRILELFSRKVCIFLKRVGYFLTYFIVLYIFVDKHFTYLKRAYLKK